MILFSSEIEFELRDKIKMNKLIIDGASEKIFLMIISNANIYNITHENTKINYEKLTIIINDFVLSKNIKITDINAIYINQGSGSFAGIRNSLATIKALFLTKKINYYCFSFEDFTGFEEVKYEDVPSLCEKFKIKKNLINPIYLS